MIASFPTLIDSVGIDNLRDYRDQKTNGLLHLLAYAQKLEVMQHLVRNHNFNINEQRASDLSTPSHIFLWRSNPVWVMSDPRIDAFESLGADLMLKNLHEEHFWDLLLKLQTPEGQSLKGKDVKDILSFLSEDLSRLAGLSIREVCLALKTFAESGSKHEGILRTSAEHLQGHSTEIPGDCLGTILWSYAKLGYCHTGFLSMILPHVQEQLNRNELPVGTCAWAFARFVAKLGFQDERMSDLSTQLCLAALQANELQTQTAWSFALLGVPNAQYYEACFVRYNREMYPGLPHWDQKTFATKFQQIHTVYQFVKVRCKDALNAMNTPLAEAMAYLDRPFTGPSQAEQPQRSWPSNNTVSNDSTNSSSLPEIRQPDQTIPSNEVFAEGLSQVPDGSLPDELQSATCFSNMRGKCHDVSTQTELPLFSTAQSFEGELKLKYIGFRVLDVKTIGYTQSTVSPFFKKRRGSLDDLLQDFHAGRVDPVNHPNMVIRVMKWPLLADVPSKEKPEYQSWDNRRLWCLRRFREECGRDVFVKAEVWELPASWAQTYESDPWAMQRFLEHWEQRGGETPQVRGEQDK
jgi:hypothetical protein